MKITITVQRYTTADDIKAMTVEALTFPDGQKIMAIKANRESWGLGLGEAKDFVETVHETRRQVTAQIQRADDYRSESIAAMIAESDRLDDLEEEAYRASRADQVEAEKRADRADRVEAIDFTTCLVESACGREHDSRGRHF